VSKKEMTYRKLLAEMKRLGLKVEDMPDEVGQSALVLHQEALLEWMREKKKGG
jgi:hypothetical protein